MTVFKSDISDIENLNSLNHNAVWGLVNEEDKKVYLAQGNILKGMTRLLDRINEGSEPELLKDLDKLELKILYEDGALDHKLALSYYYTEEFKDYYKYINYRPIKLTSRVSYREFMNMTSGQLENYYTVELVNRKWKYEIMGVFVTEDEAREFMLIAYPEYQGIYQYIGSGNELTMMYYSNKLRLNVE